MFFSSTTVPYGALPLILKVNQKYFFLFYKTFRVALSNFLCSLLDGPYKTQHNSRGEHTELDIYTQRGRSKSLKNIFFYFFYKTFGRAGQRSVLSAQHLCSEHRLQVYVYGGSIRKQKSEQGSSLKPRGRNHTRSQHTKALCPVPPHVDLLVHIRR